VQVAHPLALLLVLLEECKLSSQWHQSPGRQVPLCPSLLFLSSPGGNDGRSIVADTRRDKDITRRKSSFSGLKAKLPSKANIKEQLQNDLTVLRHIWFTKAQGDDHASRLESFYGPQAKACECCARKASDFPA